MGTIPDWLLGEKPVRKRSVKQEKALAKRYNGRATSNSGASFGENDINSEHFSIEAKFTDAKSYKITMVEFLKLVNRCPSGKIPIEIIEFTNQKESLVVIREFDFFSLFGAEK
jgi:hypothetical protein